MISSLKNFFVNVKTEMGKVSWPSREELLNSTSVVIVSVVILASCVGLIDLFFTLVVGLIIK